MDHFELLKSKQIKKNKFLNNFVNISFQSEESQNINDFTKRNFRLHCWTITVDLTGLRISNLLLSW